MSPIRRDAVHHYRTAAWRAVAAVIRNRAGGRCERCGVSNHATGYRDERGVFHEVHGDGETCEALADGWKVIRIVLTVAHLDQNGDQGIHDPERMAHWCQRCHNQHDAPSRALRAAFTRAAKRATEPGQQVLSL